MTKLNTRNKSYNLEESPLYNIQYEQKLLKILNISQNDLIFVRENLKDFYHSFSKKHRIIQTPKNLLKQIHYRIGDLLARIAMPDYLMSGKKGASHIENAKLHLQEDLHVFTADIEKFFPSTKRQAIFKFFKNKLQCSHNIATILSELCTTHEGRLPTGSQLSMHLAFWTNYNMFEKIAKLSNQYDLRFSIFVDDLTFSGKTIPHNFKYQLKKIITSYGYQINTKKILFFKPFKIRRVTGIYIKNDDPHLPNTFLRELHTALQSWKDILKTSPDKLDKKKLETTYNKLLGSINYAALLDKKYKQIRKKVIAEKQKITQYQ